MEALQEYIKKFYIDIPNYVENSKKSINSAQSYPTSVMGAMALLRQFFLVYPIFISH